jgi:glutaredoxin-related protein
MSTSSFINALRRFMAIRGKVKEFFSDRGTHYIGGAKQLGIPAICPEDRTLKTFLNVQLYLGYP